MRTKAFQAFPHIENEGSFLRQLLMFPVHPLGMMAFQLFYKPFLGALMVSIDLLCGSPLKM